MSDPIDPDKLERLRRSIAMLRADRILEELQRRQRSDRRHGEVMMRLRALIEEE